MYRLWRPMAVGALLVSLLIPSAGPAAAAGTTTRYVDGDGHASPGNCNGSGAAFRHIQKAITKSDGDDRVIVCPGTYDEQLEIKGDRDGLTVKSSTPFGATIRTPASMDPGSLGVPLFILVLGVDDVTIQGFKLVTRTHAPCTPTEATIAALGSRRTAIRGNRLLAPGAGTGTCQQQEGILILDGGEFGVPPRSSSATIGFNEIRDTVGPGVLAAGIDRMVTVDIVHNSIRAYFGESSSSAAATSATRARSTLAPRLARTRRLTPLGSSVASIAAILTELRVQGTIRNNVIQGATSAPISGPVFEYGVIVLTDTSRPNGPLDIHDNLLRRVYIGAYMIATRNVIIRRNSISNVAGGVLLTGSTDDAVRNNDISAKLGGIIVDTTSTANTFKDNTVSGNGGTCMDSSVGTGTAGTANTWTGNTATQGSNPPAICPHP